MDPLALPLLMGMAASVGWVILKRRTKKREEEREELAEREEARIQRDKTEAIARANLKAAAKNEQQKRDDGVERLAKARQTAALFHSKSGKLVFGPIVITRYINGQPRKQEQYDNLEHLKPIINEWLDRGFPEMSASGSLDYYGGPSYRFLYIRRPDTWDDDIWP